jgi:MraZ protein
MLIGRHDSKIDEKYRISFPKKFRKELGDNLIVTQGFEGSLIVISVNQLKLLLEGTEGRPIIDKNAREIERFLLGNAEQVELDDKGRFIIPTHLREYAGLAGEVSCLGIIRYVQIWDKKRWEDHNSELTKKIEPITEKLSNDLSRISE